VHRRRFVFARDEDSREVVPHHFYLLFQFRCHHCLEVIHSEQAIGYVMKYCTKNSDDGTVAVGPVLYEGAEVQEHQRLQYYAATRIASAAECFAALCGFWRHHMRPTVITLGFHLPEQKIIMTGLDDDPAERVNLPSQLEHYFGRPGSVQFTPLKYGEYYAAYLLRGKAGGPDDLPDNCEPVHFAHERENRALCIMRSVLPHQQEKFTLRLLLRHYPARD
jgi:hypothetical protein